VAHNVYYSALIYIVYSDCTAVSNSYRPLADEVFFFRLKEVRLCNTPSCTQTYNSLSAWLTKLFV